MDGARKRSASLKPAGEKSGGDERANVVRDAGAAAAASAVDVSAASSSRATATKVLQIKFKGDKSQGRVPTAAFKDANLDFDELRARSRADEISVPEFRLAFACVLDRLL